MRLLGEQVLGFQLFACPQRKQIERGKGHCRPERPVRHLQPESITQRRLPRHFGAAAAPE